MRAIAAVAIALVGVVVVFAAWVIEEKDSGAAVVTAIHGGIFVFCSVSIVADS